MHSLSYVYFVNQPLHVSGIFVAHHQEYSTYQLLYIYGVPPDDGLQLCPKHVEVAQSANQHMYTFNYLFIKTYLK